MPLVAMSKISGARIDVTQYENPRVQLGSQDVVCPECESQMILKAGAIKIAHFAHKPGSNCSYGAGETKEHLMAKAYLAHWLRGEGSGWFDVTVELEWKIANRRADVVQIFPTGWTVAHEVQLASITVEELEQRTTDYLKAGCDAIWYLGKSADTPANRRWVEHYQGELFILQFKEILANEYSIGQLDSAGTDHSTRHRITDDSVAQALPNGMPSSRQVR